MPALRTRTRVAVVVASTAMLAMMLVPGAGADRVANPGTFSIQPSTGRIVIGPNTFDLTPPTFPECSDTFDNDGDGKADLADNGCSAGPDGEPATSDASEFVVGYQPVEPTRLDGTVDADGNVTIPVEGISFPTLYIQLSTTAGSALVVGKILPTQPATGVIDPITRQANLRVRLRVALSGYPFGTNVGFGCSVGTTANPIDLNMLTTGISTAPDGTVITGREYSRSFGTITVVNNNFQVPGASGCTQNLFVNVNSLINGQLGLPSPAGKNTAVLTGAVSPAWTPRWTSGPRRRPTSAPHPCP